MSTSAPVSTAPALAHLERDPRLPAGLRIDEGALRSVAAPVRILVLAVWRYDPDGDAWETVAFTAAPETMKPRAPAGGAQPRGRVVFELPTRIGLYCLRWQEDVGGRVDVHAGTIASGGMLCNDVDVGPVPAGKIALCVPFSDRAEARIVPLPPSPR